MFQLATKFSAEAENFEKAAMAGYQAAEIYTTPTRLMSWRSLSKIARSFEMDYSLHFPTGDFPAGGKISYQTSEEIAALARDLDCSTIVVHEEHLDVAGEIKFVHPGVRLAVENHFVHFNDLQNWMGSHDAVALDIEHLWKHTLHDCELNDLLKVTDGLLTKHHDRIQQVHLPGYLPGQAIQKPMYCSREMALAMLTLLDEKNFSGMVVSETDVAYQNEHELQMDVLLFNVWSNRRRSSKAPMVGSHSSALTSGTEVTQ